MNIQDLRDILLSVYLILGILLSITLIFGVIIALKAVLGLIKAAKRPIDKLGEASGSLMGDLVNPSKDGLSMSSVAFGIISFAASMLGRAIMRSFRKKSSKRKKKRR